MDCAILNQFANFAFKKCRIITKEYLDYPAVMAIKNIIDCSFVQYLSDLYFLSNHCLNHVSQLLNLAPENMKLDFDLSH